MDKHIEVYYEQGQESWTYRIMNGDHVESREAGFCGLFGRTEAMETALNLHGYNAPHSYLPVHVYIKTGELQKVVARRDINVTNYRGTCLEPIWFPAMDFDTTREYLHYWWKGGITI
jgi:hypothetical protein